MIEQKKYTEVVLLVHPLFDIFRPYGKIRVSKFNEVFNVDNKNKLHKNLEIQLKRSLELYGKEILNHKKKKETVFVLLLPPKNARIFSRGFGNEEYAEVNEQRYKKYNELLAKFIEFGTRTLKERFVLSKDYAAYNISSFAKLSTISQQIIPRLNKNVTLRSFGEFLTGSDNGCVNLYSDVFANTCRDNNIFVKKEFIVSKSISTRSEIEINPKTFKHTFLRGKEKKEYLKDNNLKKKTIPKKQFNFKKGHKSMVK